jgi:uncharacterized protein YbjT (DUF2867 family)
LTKKTTVCLTGATGFIGQNLLEKLQQNENLEVVALSRKVNPQMDGAKKGNVTWRRCNGFSLLDAEKATEGVDVLIYLIHSMLPSTSLSQGSFKDFDLYLADNFSKACHKNKVKKIIYLSGLIPDTPKLSEHLESRLEVESALSQYGNSLITLRAGLVIGKDGSSFKILERLVNRLPVFVCPSWTKSKCQPIDLSDVLEIFNITITNYEKYEGAFDIGGDDIVTYKKMLLKTAQTLNKKRVMLDTPFFSPGLSKLWVSKITGVEHSLVYPLVESLKYNMVVGENRKFPDYDRYMSFENSLKHGISDEEQSWIRAIINYSAKINFQWMENVTSIQRVCSPFKDDAKALSTFYFKWVTKVLSPFIQVKERGSSVHFVFLGMFILLEITKSTERSKKGRTLYYVTQGSLAKKSTLNGRFEFRWIECSQCALIALQDFRPALPWFIYKYTQAIVHLYIMNKFAKKLRKLSKNSSKKGNL